MPTASAPAWVSRFWQKVDKSGECWIWQGSRQHYGHGQIKIEGKTLLTHRVSYELAHGPIPAGLVIDHACHNPPCVNPQHLRAVTQKQNIENQVRAHRSSKSGIRGVRFDHRGKKWRAEVKHHGQRISVGSFASKEDAAAAVVEARNRLFTHNDADR